MSWVSLDDTKVVSGYWGRFDNVELKATFVLGDEKWTIEDIYFQ